MLIMPRWSGGERINLAVQLVSTDLQPLKLSQSGNLAAHQGAEWPESVSCARLCNVPCPNLRCAGAQSAKYTILKPKPNAAPSCINRTGRAVARPTVSGQPPSRRRLHGTDDGRGAGARCLRGQARGTAWILGPEPEQGALRP